MPEASDNGAALDAAHENGRPPRDGLVRALARGVDFRAAGDGEGMPTLYGHFSVFDRWAEIDSWLEGHFLERIAPGAFRRTFREQAHDLLLARRRNGDGSAPAEAHGAPSGMRFQSVQGRGFQAASTYGIALRWTSPEGRERRRRGRARSRRWPSLVTPS